MKKLFIALAMFVASIAQAADLPTGYLGTPVLTGTPGYTLYSYTFTPSVTGNDYVLFAFRQDPAFWSFGNVSLIAAGSSTNLLSNGTMVNGGSITVPLNNGTTTVQAPTNWGVFYQTGSVPSAAGRWSATGGPNGGGQWYDGAVGSFDGIYQAVGVTGGTTYTISFDALSTGGINSGNSIAIGTYAGACSNLSISLAGCVLPTNLGFTTIATPAQGSNATTPGAPIPPSPSAPTVVSTAPGQSLVQVTHTSGATVNTSVITLGAAAVVAAITDTANKQPQVVDVNRNITVTTTTPVTTTVTHTTPITTTTITTPTTVTTWSDNTTTTTNGTPVTTTSTVNSVTTTSSTVNQVQVASTNQEYSTPVDQMEKLNKANQRVNQRLDSNPLDRFSVTDSALRSNTDNDKNDWVYLIGDSSWSNTRDSYSTTDQRFGIGYERSLDWNWLGGIQYNHVNTALRGEQAGGSLTKDHIGLYSLYGYEDWLLKTDLGFSTNQYNSSHSLAALGLSNSASAHGYDAWLNNRLYTPDVWGFRPYAGVRVEYNDRNSVTETGSLLTAVSYSKINSSTTSAEAGLSYRRELCKYVSLDSDVGATTDNMVIYRVGLNLINNSNLTGGVSYTDQRQEGVSNNVIQATVKYSF